jgi:citrate synthase
MKPDPNASHGANILAMLIGKRPSERAGRIFDGTLTLYAEHEFNASTFTARTIASTLSDMHSAVTGAIGALKGPLHGGANEAAMIQFTEIGKKENVEKWFRDVAEHNKKNPDNKRLIMGFGHRVYKHGDHRAGILRNWSMQLSKETGQGHWIEIADALQALMLKEKNIHPNLDYPAAHAYYQMGIPIPMYTPIFVCSRIAGWCAHIMEQYENNRIIRPLSEYAGPALREVIPIAKRP